MDKRSSIINTIRDAIRSIGKPPLPSQEAKKVIDYEDKNGWKRCYGPPGVPAHPPRGGGEKWGGAGGYAVLG